VLLSSHVLTEAALTVDDIVVIHKGRLIHEGAIGDLQRDGSGDVLVKTPMSERMAAAARRAGAEVTFDDAGCDLLIAGFDAARIGELAHDERIVLHELAPRGGSLEEMFFTLTEKEAP